MLIFVATVAILLLFDLVFLALWNTGSEGDLDYEPDLADLLDDDEEEEDTTEEE